MFPTFDWKNYSASSHRNVIRAVPVNSVVFTSSVVSMLLWRRQVSGQSVLRPRSDSKCSVCSLSIGAANIYCYTTCPALELSHNQSFQFLISIIVTYRRTAMLRSGHFSYFRICSDLYHIDRSPCIVLTRPVACACCSVSEAVNSLGFKLVFVNSLMFISVSRYWDVVRADPFRLVVFRNTVLGVDRYGVLGVF